MLVCTLPSPACMCSATNTRPRSTSAWIASTRLHHRLEVAAGEDLAQRLAQLALPGDAQLVRLHALEDVARRRRRSGQPSPSRSGALRPAAVEVARRQRQRARHAQQLQRACRRSPRARSSTSASGSTGRSPAKNCARRVGRASSLLRDRQLDVDALDAVGVVAQALQRDHHVLVDLEGVGVLGDRGGARAVEPEALALLGASPR